MTIRRTLNLTLALAALALILATLTGVSRPTQTSVRADVTWGPPHVATRMCAWIPNEPC